jgi:hypothetical protein
MRNRLQSMGRVIAWVACALLLLASCAKKHAVSVPGPGEDAFDLIHRAQVEAGAVTARDSTAHPLSAYEWWTQAPPPADTPRRPRNKIHRGLVAQLAVPGTDSVTVLVAYRDTVRVPRLPVGTSVLQSPADSLKSVSNRVLADSLLLARAADYGADSVVVSALGGRILERYWLTHSLRIRLPAPGVAALAARPEVLFIRGERAGETPPTGPCLDAMSITPCAGRSQIHSDPYRAAGFGLGRLALLDTGVRTDHDLLGLNPPRVTLFDCVDGDAAGLGGSPGDAYPGGHGTSSAALLTGGPGAPEPSAAQQNLPRPPADEYRGITEAQVESYRVYAPCATCEGGAELDAPAAKDAFGLAVIRGAPVVVAEIAGSDPDDMTLIAEAENAYAAGRVVVAANGNKGAMVAMVPAVSPRVLGIGAYDIRTPGPGAIPNLSGGITSDSIMKPDFVAPTGTETAGSEHRAHFTTFPGTSGATPYAAGAALMLWNLMRGGQPAIDPGKVYAAMVLATKGTQPFADKAGAGALRLPTNCWMLWGKVELAHGEQTTVSLQIPAAYAFAPKSVRGAIWWPRPSDGPKRNVDLFILDPAGQVPASSSASSVSKYTVFERVETAVPSGTTGVWKLRVKATEVAGGGKQVVYWAATLGRTATD